MEAETVSEMLESNSIITRLITWEDFIACSSVLQKKIYLLCSFYSTFDAIKNAVIKLFAVWPCINTVQHIVYMIYNKYI
jgi:hypothetical protein